MTTIKEILDFLGENDKGSITIVNNTKGFIKPCVGLAIRNGREETYIAVKFDETKQKPYIYYDKEANKGMINKIVEVYAYDEKPIEDIGQGSETPSNPTTPTTPIDNYRKINK